MELDQKKQFYKQMTALSIPITIQFFLTAALNMVDSLMVGQLGASSIAAVGVANKITVVLLLIFQGFASGAGIFAAQYWGKKDKVGIGKIGIITMGIISFFAFIFTLFVFSFPSQLVGVFTTDSVVIEQGSNFITLLAISYLFTGITIVMTVLLRSMGEVRSPMYISIFAIALNTGLNYLFIFGHFGFPEMGIEGAAIATVIARVIQTILMGIIIYQYQLFSNVKRLTIGEILDVGLIRRYVTVSVPSILNHIFWTLGETTYFWVYAQMGTAQLAAVTIIDPLLMLSMALFIGLGDASSVMVGNSIGEGKEKKAFDYGVKFLKITIVISIIVSSVILVISPMFVGFYNISDQAANYAVAVLVVYAFIIPFRMLNMVNNIGILRPGGDTKFVMYLDLLGVWLVGLPLALLGVYLQYPIYIIFLLANTQEIARVIFGLKRTLSKKWIKSVVNIKQKTG
ncbi:MATE family efflux transporter [Alkalihalobacillus sp. LMS39]|uniref:MATE family efflux transporter n=1 Tax=Alkalihalobacillus sp. LMS39 TaxID=2924032 RepID=UPI001FB1D192|nr:MATE family efflux transporter [Alkalihalobacillus sp. LMS39]UOE93061.1 MATE family efflux transporter [Alkalihalobacillus sp. LMS39]